MSESKWEWKQCPRTGEIRGRSGPNCRIEAVISFAPSEIRGRVIKSGKTIGDMVFSAEFMPTLVSDLRAESDVDWMKRQLTSLARKAGD